MIRALILLLGLTMPVQANVVILMDPGDVVDGSADPNTDWLSMTERFSGTGAIDADVSSQTLHTHNAYNGGWQQGGDPLCGGIPGGVPHSALKFVGRSASPPTRAYYAWVPACTCNAALDCAAAGGVCSASTNGGYCVAGDVAKLDCRNATSGESDDLNCAADRGCAPRQKLSEDFVAISGSMWVDTFPPAGRSKAFADMVLSDGTLGCFARLNSDGAVSVYYQDSTLTPPDGGLVGTSSAKFTRTACTENCGTVAEEKLLSCNGADQTCPAGSSCGTCNTGGGANDGQGCFWGGWELTQTNSFTNGTGVTFCDLWMNGSQQVFGSANPVKSNNPKDIADFHIGFDCTLGGSGCSTSSAEDPGVGATVIAYISDVVVSTDVRQGWGYVASLTPSGVLQTQFGANGGDDCTVSTIQNCVNKYAYGRCVAGTNVGKVCVSDGNGTPLPNCPSSTCGSKYLYDDSHFMNVPQSLPVVSRLTPFAAIGTSLFVLNGTSAKVAGVESVLVGFQGASVGERDMKESIGVVGSSAITPHQFHLACQSCGPPGTPLMKKNPISRILDRVSTTVSPTAKFDAAFFAGLESQVETAEACTGSVSQPTVIPCMSPRNFGIGAIQMHVRVRRPDSPPFITIRDHNVGVKTCTAGTDCIAVTGTCPVIGGNACSGGLCVCDGKRSIWTFGDSTNGGTVGASCQGGTNAGLPCSQPSHCSNDDTADHPQGGCGIPPNNLDKAQCITCTGQRGNFNGGAGYPCTGDLQCGDTATWTCSNSQCVQNPSLKCANDGDCHIGNLGTCELSRTCDDSCPGGACRANLTPWSLPIREKTGADTIVHCGIGGATSQSLTAVHIPPGLYGRDPAGSCFADQGFGQCSCDPAAAGAECGSGGVCSTAAGKGFCANDATKPCTTNTDCALGGGVICLGLCTAGSSLRTECKDPALDCYVAGGVKRTCVWDPPDVVGVTIGDNDMAFERDTAVPIPQDPHCNNGQYNNVFCGNQCPGGSCITGACVSGTRAGLSCCTPTKCTNDNDCSGIAADSHCVGTSTITGFNPVDYGLCLGGGACTTQILKCRTPTYFCPVCLGGNPSDITPRGLCKCTSDTDCSLWGPNFVCAKNGQANGYCRPKCTLDTNCHAGGSQSCVTDTGGSPARKVCQGQCSCPSDRTPCTTDAQCANINATTQPMWGGRTLIQDGTCVTGKCQYTGVNRCWAWQTCQAGTNIGLDCKSTTDCPGGGSCPATSLCSSGTCGHDAGSLKSYAAMSKVLGHYTARDYLRTLDAMLKAFGPIHPLLVVGTNPLTGQSRTSPCPEGRFRNWLQDDYFYKSREYLKSFPNAVDAMEAMVEAPFTRSGPTAGDDSSELLADQVHPTGLGANVWGGEWGDWFKAENTCSQTCAVDTDCRHRNSLGDACVGGTNDGALCKKCAAGANGGQLCRGDTDCPLSVCANNCTGGGHCVYSCDTTTHKCKPWLRKPKLYCLKGDGFTYATPVLKCASNTDCAPGQTCQLRLCTVATEASDCPTDTLGNASYCNEEVL